MMCPFCFALGIATCCRTSGCWNRIAPKPAMGSAAELLEARLLTTMLALGCFDPKPPPDPAEDPSAYDIVFRGAKPPTSE